jgi:hypothetical protein
MARKIAILIREGARSPRPYSVSLMIKSIRVLTRFRIAVIRTTISTGVALLPFFFFFAIVFTSLL